MCNPCGSRSLTEFLQGMKITVDILAMIDCPVSNEDLVVNILNNLGPEYKELGVALRARDSTISFSELHDKLLDFAIQLKKEETPTLIAPTPVTANYTIRHNQYSYRRVPNSFRVSSSPQQSSINHVPSTKSTNSNSWQSTSSRANRSSLYWRFCECQGHNTFDCCKLQWFLRENNVQPIVNSTNSIIFSVMVI